MARDYVLRLIQQVANLLASVLARRVAGDASAARKEVEDLCVQTVGLSLTSVKAMTPDALAAHLSAAGGLGTVRAVMLAELLLQDGELCDDSGNVAGGWNARLHAFCLLHDAYPLFSPEERMFYLPKLQVLAGRFAPLPPNDYTTQRVESVRRMVP
jgi:hypothetical protein